MDHLCKVAKAFGIGGMLALATSCNDPQLNVIGLDKNGNPGHVAVPESEYVERTTQVAEAFQDSALLALEKGSSDSQDEPQWMLRTLVVGVGVNMDIGVNDLTVGVAPRFRMVFTNGTNTPIP